MRHITPTNDAEGMHRVITVSPKRQITLRRFVHEVLDIKPGDTVRLAGHLLVEAGDRLRLTIKNGHTTLRSVVEEA